MGGQKRLLDRRVSMRKRTFVYAFVILTGVAGLFHSVGNNVTRPVPKKPATETMASYAKSRAPAVEIKAGFSVAPATYEAIRQELQQQEIARQAQSPAVQKVRDLLAQNAKQPTTKPLPEDETMAVTEQAQASPLTLKGTPKRKPAPKVGPAETPQVVAAVAAKSEKVEKELPVHMEEGKFNRLYPIYQTVEKLIDYPAIELLAFSYWETKIGNHSESERNYLQNFDEPFAFQLYQYGPEIVETINAKLHHPVDGKEYRAIKSPKKPSTGDDLVYLVNMLKKCKGKPDRALMQRVCNFRDQNPFIAAMVSGLYSREYAQIVLNKISSPELAKDVEDGIHYVPHNWGNGKALTAAENPNGSAAIIPALNRKAFGIEKTDTLAQAMCKVAIAHKNLKEELRLYIKTHQMEVKVIQPAPVRTVSAVIDRNKKNNRSPKI